MTFSVFEKITDGLANSGIIPTEDKELYTYGFCQGFFIILNVTTVIIIGFIFRMVLESIIFTLAYIPLRSYAGGYHAKTHARCYLFSIVMMVTVLSGIKLIPWNSFICLTTSLFSSIIVFLFAPVEDSNKPLEQKELVVYRKRAHILLSTLIGLAFVFWSIGWQQISICIVTAVTMLAIMLILGKINNMIGVQTI